MEVLEVEKVVICKQGKDTENYEKFKKITQEKNIKAVMVEKR